MDMLNLYLHERLMEQELAGRRQGAAGCAGRSPGKPRWSALRWLGRCLIVIGMRLSGDDARTAALGR
jgi:hypothetical protein